MDLLIRLAESGWGAEVAEAVATTLARHPTEVRVETIRVVAANVVEFVYRQPPEGELRGVRLSAPELEWNPILTEYTPSEIAFIVAYVGILEPRHPGEFALPDSAGIRWMLSYEWLDR